MSASVEFAINHSPVDDLAALEQNWKNLEARSECSFFLSWHWIGTWLKLVGQPVVCVSASADGEVVGLALFCRQSLRRHRLWRINSLFLHATGIAEKDVITIEYNQLLVDRRFGTRISSAMLQYLAQTDHILDDDWDELTLPGVTEALVTSAIGATGLHRDTYARAPSAFVDLAEIRDSGTDFLDHISSNSRSQIRRSIKLYEASGPLQITAAANPVQALEFFDAALKLQQVRWSKKGQVSALDHPHFVEFHRKLIESSFTDGVTELVKIASGTKVIGYLYNFIYRKKVYFYFCGLLYEDHKHLKPGLVSHVMCINRHIESGNLTYDFMAGENQYKTSLGQPGPDILTVRLQKHRLKLRTIAWLKRIKQGLLRTSD